MFGFTWQKIAAVVQGRLEIEGNCPEPLGACIDTRDLKKGDLFFALPGEKTDGHYFLEEARQKGARGAVVTYQPEGFSFLDFPLVIVENPVKALQQLAIAQRNLFSGQVVAVTGSVGKTTTKEMIYTLLQEKGSVWKTLENYNNELGLPLTILALKPEHQFMVVEMGMRALGEIDFLCRISQPDYGVITNIGHTHAELLGSPEKIAQAKAELISHLPAQGGLVLPYAAKKMLHPWLTNIRCPLLWFGLNSRADISAEEICVQGEKGLSFNLLYRGEKISEINLPLPGRHNVFNALAALAVGKHLGFSGLEMKTGLAKVELPGMRLEFSRTASGEVQVINDTYNANPDSMLSALEVLEQAAQGKRAIGVLGDMYELGNYTEAGHLLVGRQAKEKGLAYLITVGKLGEIIAQGAREAGMSAERVYSCHNNVQALSYLRKIKQPGDVILVKGSRGVKMEEIVAGLVAG